MSNYSYYINANWTISHKNKKVCVNPLFLRKYLCDPNKHTSSEREMLQYGFDNLPILVNFMHSKEMNNADIICSNSAYVLSFDESMTHYFSNAKNFCKSYIPNLGNNGDIYQELLKLGFTSVDQHSDITIVFLNENPLPLIARYLNS